MSMIYLVEDEASLNDLITLYLKEAGYEVQSFYDGRQAFEHLSDQPDLWVLDIMLPGVDGYTLLREIRRIHPNIPIIFASARSAELDRVLGLELGSDDYLPKPYLPRELVLRVDRILKSKPRYQAPSTNAISSVDALEEIKLGPYCFSRKERSVLTDTEAVLLTIKEYDLLELLIRSSGRALSRDELIDQVWGNNYFGSTRVVDDTLRRLRKKMPLLPIEPVYGYGYLLRRNSNEN